MFCVSTKTNGFEEVIDCKIRVQKILEDDKFIKQYGEDADLEEISITSKMIFLKTHEARRLTRKNISKSKDEAMKATNSIEPFCKEMKDVLSMQNEVM